MNGFITDDPSRADLEQIRAFRCENPVSQVTIHEPTLFRGRASRRLVVMLDFGRKDNILRSIMWELRQTNRPGSKTSSTRL